MYDLRIGKKWDSEDLHSLCRYKNIRARLQMLEQTDQLRGVLPRDRALVRVEYHASLDNNASICRGYVWVTRRELLDLYCPRDPRGQLLRQNVSLHETFPEDASAKLMFDMDGIEEKELEQVRRDTERRLIAFWNRTFAERKYQIDERHILWQDILHSS